MEKKTSYSGLASGDKKIIDAAAAFIIPFEGFAANPFWDFQQWTIGYGTLAGHDINQKPNYKVTQTEAALLLKDELCQYLPKVSKLKTDNQKIGFISFGFNTGAGALNGLMTRLNKGESLASVVTSLKKYVNAGGKPVQGLITRRNAEANKILS